MAKTNPTTYTERRVSKGLEIRGDGGSSPAVLTGYAAVFEVLSEPLWFGREKIRAGAFARSLREGADVVALYDHAGQPIARSTSGTLKLREDDHGLHDEIDTADTQVGRDVVTLVRRGDLDAQSFGFFVEEDEWRTVDGEQERTLIDASLFDVSIVTWAAYRQTDVEAGAKRSLDRYLQAHQGENLSHLLASKVAEANRSAAFASIEERTGIPAAEVEKIFAGDQVVGSRRALADLAGALEIRSQAAELAAAGDGLELADTEPPAADAAGDLRRRGRLLRQALV